MILSAGKIIFSPSDLSGHISCRHPTKLNKDLVLNKISAPIHVYCIYLNRLNTANESQH